MCADECTHTTCAVRLHCIHHWRDRGRLSRVLCNKLKNVSSAHITKSSLLTKLPSTTRTPIHLLLFRSSHCTPPPRIRQVPRVHLGQLLRLQHHQRAVSAYRPATAIFVFSGATGEQGTLKRTERIESSKWWVAGETFPVHTGPVERRPAHRGEKFECL